MIVAPTTTSCQNGCDALDHEAVLEHRRHEGADGAHQDVPTPPKRLVPPMTTALIAARLSVRCETEVVFV